MLHQTLTANSARNASLPAPAKPDHEHEDSLAAAFSMLGAPIRFDRNIEIYGEGEPAEFFYQVVTGAVRTYKTLENGRRQIGAFHLAPDVFGLAAGPEHSFSAEAIVNSTVRVARRSTIIAMAARDNAIGTDLWNSTADGLRLAQDHMLLLGRKNAEERVATFLLDMARRVSTDHVVELPMSRQDIADYLGLTIETISRTLTQLEQEEVIDVASSRRIVLRNRGRLQRLNA